MRLSLAATLAASLFLAGCGGDEGSSADPSKEPSGTPKSSSTPAPPPPTWPLTGLEVAAGQAPTSPAYIVKIDNSEKSRPQYGLGQADLVVEELVEGDYTRLAAVFHSQLPTRVGPVRSMRLTDIGIAKPIGAEIVASGAAPVTINGLNQAGQPFLTFDRGTPGIRRQRDGVHDSLHSVVADLQQIAAGKQMARPADYLPFGKADLPAGAPATVVDAKMSKRRTSTWQFQNGKYVLQNGYMPEGDVFLADTVITIKVRTSIAGYRDPAGSPVPISHFEGSGEAVIFHGGKAITATWTKPTVADVVTFSTAAGPLKVPAGKSFLHLVPQNGGAVSFR